MIPLGTFEQPVFEVDWTRRNAFQQIRVWHRKQRGRSIAVRNCWDEGMMLPCIGRERSRTLSRRVDAEAGRRWNRVRTSSVPRLFSFAHSPKVNELERLPPRRTAPASGEIAAAIDAPFNFSTSCCRFHHRPKSGKHGSTPASRPA